MSLKFLIFFAESTNLQCNLKTVETIGKFDRFGPSSRNSQKFGRQVQGNGHLRKLFSVVAYH